MTILDDHPDLRTLSVPTPASPPLAVALTMDDSTRGTLRRNEGAIALAEAFTIDSQDMADEAVGQLQAWKGAANKLDLLYRGFVEPAKSIIERARDLFNPARIAIAEGDRILRGKLTAWTDEQQRLVDEQRAAAAAREREARQKAERDAAQARAAADAEAASQRRIEQQARQALLDAQAAGNAEAARAAAARAAEAAANANAAIENGEHHAVTATLEAAATNVVIAAPTPTKGFALRDCWKAELSQGTSESQAIQLIAAAIAGGRTDLCAYLSLDLKAADKGAKALKDHFAVPGLVAVNRQSSVVRGGA